MLCGKWCLEYCAIALAGTDLDSRAPKSSAACCVLRVLFCAAPLNSFERDTSNIVIFLPDIYPTKNPRSPPPQPPPPSSTDIATNKFCYISMLAGAPAVVVANNSCLSAWCSTMPLPDEIRFSDISAERLFEFLYKIISLIILSFDKAFFKLLMSAPRLVHYAAV